jgi:hypothetical protein
MNEKVHCIKVAFNDIEQFVLRQFLRSLVGKRQKRSFLEQRSVASVDELGFLLV